MPRRRKAGVAINLERKFLMLNGKLRIAPTCYHVLHLIPVTSAHEMGFFYDEGLKKDVCAQDLVTEAYKELMERQALQQEYKRVAAIAKKWGY